MNRGRDSQALFNEVQYRASMRPRFMNRGRDSSDWRRTWHSSSFNEAPIHESGKEHAPERVAASNVPLQ